MAEKKFPSVKEGSSVQVVLANGQRVAAVVTKIHKAPGLVDLEFEHDGATVEITSSPFDEDGKRSDCWCGALKPAEEAKAQ